MEDNDGRSYGFGLSRERHIAFASVYLAVLVTIGIFGAQRFLARLPVITWPVVRQAPAPVAFREKPVPDPAFPHAISLYPRVAILNRQQGTVVVRLLILQSGEVGDVSVVRSSGYPQLDAAALVGTGSWRYLPAVRNGAPVSAEITVAIRFKLT